MAVLIVVICFVAVVVVLWLKMKQEDDEGLENLKELKGFDKLKGLKDLEGPHRTGFIAVAMGVALVILWCILVFPPLFSINPMVPEAQMRKDSIIMGRTLVVLCIGGIAGCVTALITSIRALQDGKSKRSPGVNTAIGAVSVFFIADLLILVLFAGADLMSGQIKASAVDSQPIRILVAVLLAVVFIVYSKHFLVPQRSAKDKTISARTPELWFLSARTERKQR